MTPWCAPYEGFPLLGCLCSGCSSAVGSDGESEQRYQQHDRAGNVPGSELATGKAEAKDSGGGQGSELNELGSQRPPPQPSKIEKGTYPCMI